MPDAFTSFNLLADKYDRYSFNSPQQNPLAWFDKLLTVQKCIGEKTHKLLIISHYKNMNKGQLPYQ